ncbi:WD40-repeat-containing domain protein [Lineolata rhizophorae]|uniref:WD40-repeat-containing domain protein n=1 Tax=Lineolata rhizophorae TaxID=578093 RepID=A0A6A6P0L7_9PEZI|nr:WD40-repeat-containing domain protein [Lineolata rhizophorae]
MSLLSPERMRSADGDGYARSPGSYREMEAEPQRDSYNYVASSENHAVRGGDTPDGETNLYGQGSHSYDSPEEPNGSGDYAPPSLLPQRPSKLYFKPALILRGHKRGVAAVKFSPDGKLIASCSADCTIKVWDAQTGKHQHTLQAHLAGISTIAWSPDSKMLASGSDDKSIRLWDVASGRAHRTPLVGHHNYVYSVAFSPKGNMIVSGSYDEAVYIWDVRSARVMRTLPAHADPVSGVDFVRDGTLIASCSHDGLIRIWDTATGQCLRTLVHEDNAPVVGVRFSPNGKYVLAWTLDSCLRLWNYIEGRAIKTYQGHKNLKYSLGGCFGIYGPGRTHPLPPPLQLPRYDDDDSEYNGHAGQRQDQAAQPIAYAFIASGSEDGAILLWDPNKVKGHEGAVLGVDAHPTESVLVTAGMDGTVRVWRHDGAAAAREAEEAAKEEQRRAAREVALLEAPTPTPTTADVRMTDYETAEG